MNSLELEKALSVDLAEREQQLYANIGDVAYDYLAQAWLRWDGERWNIA